MIWEWVLCISMAAAAAFIYELIKALIYLIIWKDVVRKSDILKQLDRLAAAEEKTLQNDAFPPVHREAMIRINQIINIKEIIKHL